MFTNATTALAQTAGDTNPLSQEGTLNIYFCPILASISFKIVTLSCIIEVRKYMAAYASSFEGTINPF